MDPDPKKGMVKIILVDYQNSGEILNKLKSKGVSASCLSRYGFSTLYTTSSHNLFKEKLTELINQTFNREGSLYLACNEIHAFLCFQRNSNRTVHPSSCPVHISYIL